MRELWWRQRQPGIKSLSCGSAREAQAVRGLGWSFIGRTNEELTVEADPSLFTGCFHTCTFVRCCQVDAEGYKTPRVYQVLAAFLHADPTPCMPNPRT